MQMFRLLITGCMMFMLTGCFQLSTVVRVNPDGSGTVEESMMLSKKIFGSIEESMQGLAGESGGKPKPLNLFEPEKLKKQAATMGTGVTYRSGKKVETKEYTGYTATFAFTDINKLKLNQQSGDPTGGKSDSLPITFRYTKGSPATLVIEQPRMKPAEKTTASAAEPTPATTPAPAAEPSPPAAAQPAMSDAETKQFMNMFMGMKVVLAVEVNGTIVSTNATHREGKRLTLVELDFAKFGTAVPQLEKLSRLQNSSFEDAKEMIKDIPGMKVEMNDKLTVVFKK